MSDYGYKKTKYDTILFRVKKGKADDYRQAAEDLGIGFWALIQSGVEEYIQNHSGEAFKPSTPKSPPTACHALIDPLSQEPLLSKEQRLLLDEFNQLPVDTQKAIVKLIRSVNAQSRTDN